MCGIFGYIGNKECISLLMEGLKKLEYRGYDSAGISVIDNDKLITEKCAGKISELEKQLDGNSIKSHIGIAHTRWATHGRPSDENSHPHTDCKDEIAVVHNGIIENYLQLRRELSADGHVFKSTTDTEVIAHLIEKYFKGNLEEAVRKAIAELVGSFAIAVISSREPEKIIAAKQGSPLKIGLGDGEVFIASDIPALIKYTGKVIFMGEQEMAVVTKNDVKVTDFAGNPIKKEVTLVSWDPVSAEKGGYSHFMLKEIHEQPRAIKDTIADRIKDGKIHFDELDMDDKELSRINRVVFTACGTSWHAGLDRRISDRTVRENPVRGGIRRGVQVQASCCG